MSNVKSAGMVGFRKDQAKRYRKMVMTALRDEHHGLASREIKVKLDEYVRNVKQKNDEALYEHERIFILSDSPGFSTIQRVLRNLIKDKLVERNGTKYKLTQAAYDVRHWSEELGMHSLFAAAGCYYPTVNRLNQNVDNLINMFGTYIVFCFLEISKRNPELKLKLDQYDINDERERMRALGEIDNMTCEAVKNLFDPSQMYRNFLATMKAQSTEEEIQQTMENRFKIIDERTMIYLDKNGNQSSPPSINDFSLLHAGYEGSTASAYEKTHNTIYELDPIAVSAIEQELQKRSPVLFKSLSMARAPIAHNKA